MASSASAIDLIRKIRTELEKKYKDSTELFPDFTVIKKIEVIPTGSSIVNLVTGVGGYPRGRVTEIYGEYSSGKTTLAIESMAECQKLGGRVLFLDYEHALDLLYARKLGLSLSADKFIFAQPEYFEQGAEIADRLIDADLIDMVVIDSGAAMTPRVQMEGGFDEEGGSQKGTQAALMANFLAVMTKKINKGRKPVLLLLNQTRAYINIGGPRQKNAPKSQPAGGNAIKFYTSIRMELEDVTFEGKELRDTKGTDQVYTQKRVRVTAKKNKLAPPFIRGQIVIEFGKGINDLVSIGELAEARLNIMHGAGFYRYEGRTPQTSVSCRGREEFLRLLEESPALAQEIEAKVLETIQSDHAKSLGLKELKLGEDAKMLESDSPGTLLLETGDGPPNHLSSGDGMPLDEDD